VVILLTVMEPVVDQFSVETGNSKTKILRWSTTVLVFCLWRIQAQIQMDPNFF
jgi:hypothetical protein